MDIVWHPAPPQRRITAYLVDWGIACLFTAVLAGPATIEWGMPRPTLIPAIAVFYILWKSTWIIVTGRTFGHKATGIWLLTKNTEPAKPDTKQRIKLAIFWAAASFPPILLVAHPAIAYSWIRSPHANHVIETMTNTTAAVPQLADQEEIKDDASPHDVLTNEDGK